MVRKKNWITSRIVTNEKLRQDKKWKNIFTRHFCLPCLFKYNFLNCSKLQERASLGFFLTGGRGTSGSKPSPFRSLHSRFPPPYLFTSFLEPLFDCEIVSIVAKLSPISLPLKNSYFCPFLPWLTYPSRPPFSRTSPPSSLTPWDLHANVYLKEFKVDRLQIIVVAKKYIYVSQLLCRLIL